MNDLGHGSAPHVQMPPSPLDEFIAEALRWLQDRQQLAVSDVAERMSEHLNWPLGFAEVVTHALRVNHLLRPSKWEPRKLAVSDHGVMWLNAHDARR